jgi:hypothetical protein
MADAIQDLADIPKDFFKDGTAFINRCTKRMSFPFIYTLQLPRSLHNPSSLPLHNTQANRTPLSSGPSRIHQDQPSSRHGLPDHGRNRLRHQTDPYPGEQYISGRCLGGTSW